MLMLRTVLCNCSSSTRRAPESSPLISCRQLRTGMKKGKKLDGVKADLQLGDKMVLNDFIRVAATMHARGLEPEPEKKKKEKEEKV